MRRIATRPTGPASLPPDPGLAELIAALPVAVLAIDPAGHVARANAAAEQLLDRSERLMLGHPLATILPQPDHASRADHDLAAYDLAIETARGQRLRVDFLEARLPDYPGWRVVTLHPAAAAHRLSHGIGRGGGARAAVGAAAMLAHEIKNPLSGIRGAAQLIEAGGKGGELTTLIVTEVDRIAALIDRMEDFSDTRPLPVEPLNIYPLLGHVRSLALAGFAAGVPVDERFDPSLPAVLANRDALTQVLLNLLKNAREAVRDVAEPRLVLATAYRHGMAMRAAPGVPRRALPIEIAVIDNGAGAPVDLVDHLFDPFVSGRPEGQGLGLALVDKLVRDMGGMVQYARQASPAATTFRLLLPRADA